MSDMMTIECGPKQTEEMKKLWDTRLTATWATICANDLVRSVNIQRPHKTMRRACRKLSGRYSWSTATISPSKSRKRTRIYWLFPCLLRLLWFYDVTSLDGYDNKNVPRLAGFEDKKKPFLRAAFIFARLASWEEQLTSSIITQPLINVPLPPPPSHEHP